MKEEDIQWYHSSVKPHEEMIRHWIKSKYGKYCDVDDVMQEALLQLFKAKEGKVIESPKAYFFSVARNIAVSQIRKSRVRLAESIYDESALQIIDDDVCVEEEAARNHELEILTKAIQSLPERCQCVFTLSKVYGMSYKNIAKELGISFHTVTNQIATGISKITDYMHRHGRN